MHTEAEATELWCPKRHFHTDTGLTPPACMCIASKCAMWRWGHKLNPDYHPAEMFNGLLIQNWVEPYVRDTERGHCGLAGRPS